MFFWKFPLDLEWSELGPFDSRMILGQEAILLRPIIKISHFSSRQNTFELQINHILGGRAYNN